MSACERAAAGHRCTEHVFHCPSCHDGWREEDARRELSVHGDSMDCECNCGAIYEVIVHVAYEVTLCE